VFEQDVSESGVVTVLSIEEKEGRKARPLPFNTVELLKAASKGLGMSPSAAMSCAERLYLSGSVSALVSHTHPFPFSSVFGVGIFPIRARNLRSTQHLSI
jgi:hypothetical protein